MNSTSTITAEVAGTIHYSQALSTKNTDTATGISPVETQCFRVPRVRLKHGAREDTSGATTKEDRGDSTQTPDNETCNGLPSRSETHFASYEFVLEELSRRAQAKTLLLEEVLQRCERSQLRFWGINE